MSVYMKFGIFILKYSTTTFSPYVTKEIFDEYGHIIFKNFPQRIITEKLSS